ncbi:MAG: hypothetical protein FWB90_09965 [Fibromonadales bacterium]|nr:hypothetical protein [Fibromonadales bacterium]
MKFNLFSALIALTFIVLAFFACSSDSTDKPNIHGATDIGSQLYVGFSEQLLEQCNGSDAPEACVLDYINNHPVPYTGSGVLKELISEHPGEVGSKIIDTVKVGTVTNGRVNLDLYTPNEDKHMLYDLMLYNSVNELVGRLILGNFKSTNEDTYAWYVYSLKDEEYKDADEVPDSYGIIRIDDYEWKEGWNIYYYHNKNESIGGQRIHTITKTTSPRVLSGGELRWYLFDPDIH